MVWVDHTFFLPEENLAADEALLDLAERGEWQETLRVWEPPAPFVVLGYSNEAAREVRLEACRERQVPVLRRCSGGGTVLQGPGCLNFALILRIGPGTPLASITGANRWIMERHRDLLRRRFPGRCGDAEVLGHTDLVVRGRKCSGNAQRRRREFLLFHGAFLLHLDLDLMEQLLPQPSREPAYRMSRRHGEFLANLELDAAEFKRALREEWHASDERLPPWRGEVEQRVRERYARPEWNLRA